MILTKKLKESIIDHAAKEYPKEACGLVINKEYIPCKNVAEDPTKYFSICPIDLVKASSNGSIAAYVHSHPNGSAEPTEPDLVGMENNGKPWIICGYIPDDLIEVKIHNPTGYKLPLLGRNYYHGLQDCYTLIKDYYYRELNIVLKDYERLDNWWQDKNAKSLYLDNFKKEGFIEVKDGTIQKHDIILFRLGRTYHINHAGIFLGDGILESEDTPKVIGNSLFIHHPYNKLSVRDIYGDVWSKRTDIIIRHKDLI